MLALLCLSLVSAPAALAQTVSGREAGKKIKKKSGAFSLLRKKDGKKGSK